MDLLEKKTFYNNLYDFYKDLLTTKQRDYFQKYYFDDLSLSEIAEHYHISRNAIYDQLQKVYLSLEKYEEKLGLLDRYQKRQQLYEEYIKFNHATVIELIEKLKDLE